MGDLACQFIHSRQASLRDKGLRISQELQGLESSAPANCHRQEPVTLVKRDHNGPRFSALRASAVPVLYGTHKSTYGAGRSTTSIFATRS